MRRRTDGATTSKEVATPVSRAGVLQPIVHVVAQGKRQLGCGGHHQRRTGNPRDDDQHVRDLLRRRASGDRGPDLALVGRRVRINRDEGSKPDQRRRSIVEHIRCAAGGREQRGHQRIVAERQPPVHRGLRRRQHPGTPASSNCASATRRSSERSRETRASARADESAVSRARPRRGVRRLQSVG